jgi:hypothetical protein
MQTNGSLDEEYVMGHFGAELRTDSEGQQAASTDGAHEQSVSGSTTLQALASKPVYLQDTYSNGDLCSLTGKLRHTKVRFVCQEKLPNMMILSYAETSTCEYLVVVSAPSLCRHQAFTDKVRNSGAKLCIVLN